MQFFHSVAELLFPPRCLGCGVLGQELCPSCSDSWVFRRYVTHIEDLIVYSAISYNPIAGRILLASKEDSIHVADSYIRDAMGYSLELFCAHGLSGFSLVPIPSRANSTRRRGRDFLGKITAELAAPRNLEIRNILFHTRGVKDQSTLDAHSRFENLHCALSAANVVGRGRRLVLVDDLVTTGATLREASRALRCVGFEVAGAITACVALPLR